MVSVIICISLAFYYTVLSLPLSVDEGDWDVLLWFFRDMGCNTYIPLDCEMYSVFLFHIKDISFNCVVLYTVSHALLCDICLLVRLFPFCDCVSLSVLLHCVRSCAMASETKCTREIKTLLTVVSCCTTKVHPYLFSTLQFLFWGAKASYLYKITVVLASLADSGANRG